MTKIIYWKYRVKYKDREMFLAKLLKLKLIVCSKNFISDQIVSLIDGVSKDTIKILIKAEDLQDFINMKGSRKNGCF